LFALFTVTSPVRVFADSAVAIKSVLSGTLPRSGSAQSLKLVLYYMQCGSRLEVAARGCDARARRLAQRRLAASCIGDPTSNHPDLDSNRIVIVVKLPPVQWAFAPGPADVRVPR
jgi:hypothetical protein